MELTNKRKGQIARRQTLLEEIFSGLQGQLEADFDFLELNTTVLHNVVASYFHDVDRHKSFHEIQRVDVTKQGAFIMKWLAKLRPIQFSCAAQDVTEDILYINEIFAVRAGLAFLQMSPDALPRTLYADLLYTLRNRQVDDRMLFIWLATLKHATQGGFGADA